MSVATIALIIQCLPYLESLGADIVTLITDLIQHNDDPDADEVRDIKTALASAIAEQGEIDQEIAQITAAAKAKLAAG